MNFQIFEIMPKAWQQQQPGVKRSDTPGFSSNKEPTLKGSQRHPVNSVWHPFRTQYSLVQLIPGVQAPPTAKLTRLWRAEHDTP